MVSEPLLDQDAVTITGHKTPSQPSLLISSGVAGSATYSGCVLAVGLSMEIVRIPLLPGDDRHLQTVCATQTS